MPAEKIRHTIRKADFSRFGLASVVSQTMTQNFFLDSDSACSAISFEILFFDFKEINPSLLVANIDHIVYLLPLLSIHVTIFFLYSKPLPSLTGTIKDEFTGPNFLVNPITKS